MKKTKFKPQFTVKNTKQAKNLARLSVGAEILSNHHHGAGQKHKYQAPW